MLACIALTAFVNLSGHMPGDAVRHEWHSFRFCQPAGRALFDTRYPGARITLCEAAANSYLAGLQYAGILPGASEIVSYRATCTTEM